MSRPLASALRQPARALPLPRLQPPHRQCTAIQSQCRHFRSNGRLRGLRDVYSNEPAPPPNTYDPIAMHRYATARRAYWWRRQKVAMAGMVCGMAGMMAMYLMMSEPTKSDAGDSNPISGPTTVERMNALRATGTDSVPWFPRTIRLPISSASSDRAATGPTAALPAGTALPGSDNTEELTLLGLGIRTVSFLRIQVYVVGLYVATADLAALQSRLVRAGASVEGASTLVGPEVDELRRKLHDPEEGMAIWDQILREDGIRSVIRVTPTRKTDYSHLRDGWVTGLMARSGNANVGVNGERFDDDAFGNALQQFKAMFGTRKSLGKGRIMLLEREASGRLVAWEEQGEPAKPRVDVTKVNTAKFQNMGSVEDERISRLIWLGYLAGAKVSSEAAREDVLEGIMELATRPIGTVETQVV